MQSSTNEVKKFPLVIVDALKNSAEHLVEFFFNYEGSYEFSMSTNDVVRLIKGFWQNF